MRIRRRRIDLRSRRIAPEPHALGIGEHLGDRAVADLALHVCHQPASSRQAWWRPESSRSWIGEQEGLELLGEDVARTHWYQTSLDMSSNPAAAADPAEVAVGQVLDLVVVVEDHAPKR